MAEAPEDSFSLADLPEELFVMVSSRLPLKDCVRAERVNSHWREVMLQLCCM